MCELRRLRDVGVGWGGCLGRVWDFFYNVFQLPNRTPPPPLCELAGPAGWGFEYMLYYWAWQGTNVLFGNCTLCIIFRINGYSSTSI
jgi:hypothetical protein